MAVPEARLERDGTGVVPVSEGWFVVNLAEARGYSNGANGTYTAFEGRDTRFPHFGIGVHWLWPGQANGLYHGEDGQEAFMVLEGECLLIVEGQERMLRRWDFFHCPPRTLHITVGAGDGPCAILMAGARNAGRGVFYPVDEVAARHGASAASPTDDPRIAYAGTPSDWRPVRLPPPPAG